MAIWAFEPHEGGIVASELMRDAGLRKGYQVRVTGDTFHDHRNLFYFSTNPLAALKDAYSSDNGTMNFDWNAVWEVRTSRDEDGWYSEFEIPQSQLRFRDQDGEQVWGINVVHIIAHTREESSGPESSAVPCQVANAPRLTQPEVVRGVSANSERCDLDGLGQITDVHDVHHSGTAAFQWSLPD